MKEQYTVETFNGRRASRIKTNNRIEALGLANAYIAIAKREGKRLSVWVEDFKEPISRRVIFCKGTQDAKSDAAERNAETINRIMAGRAAQLEEITR